PRPWAITERAGLCPQAGARPDREASGILSDVHSLRQVETRAARLDSLVRWISSGPDVAVSGRRPMRRSGILAKAGPEVIAVAGRAKRSRQGPRPGLSFLPRNLQALVRTTPRLRPCAFGAE